VGRLTVGRLTVGRLTVGAVVVLVAVLGLAGCVGARSRPDGGPFVPVRASTWPPTPTGAPSRPPTAAEVLAEIRVAIQAYCITQGGLFPRPVSATPKDGADPRRREWIVTDSTGLRLQYDHAMHKIYSYGGPRAALPKPYATDCDASAFLRGETPATGP
jgi:hypothetical protein